MKSPKTKPLLLIVDGSADHLQQLSHLLEDKYAVRAVDDGDAALAAAGQLPRPELILVDVVRDGFAVCRRLRGNPDTASIPMIAMIERGQPEQEQSALAEGASDVVARPLVPELLHARIATQLQLREARAKVQRQRSQLNELGQIADAAAWAIASLAEWRDEEDPSHLRRIQHIVLALARQLQGNPRFADELVEAHIPLLFKAAPLHDIGKVRIPDAILLKPGRLTPEEFEVMKQHTVHGRDAIAGVERELGFSNAFLRFAREITFSHQERYDGSGYPQGLAGDAIPVSARLVAVADVYDALVSRRVYRPAFTHETAIELIRQGSGEQFDPDVVDALLAAEENVKEIALRYHDATE
ncbi:MULTISPECIES: HD-GYP domain-containing protein [unclassified Duganella]|uniref:HD-GYP domain-containing protein n=1 Tax=unclassified Duganella TaxID=2636909 RepID=UPI0006FD0186|nr:MULTISPECIES: HD domain-containing phosphohydrolase [unclassified Duganella]KQV54016.1 two-component system response regulator [Duganella sp. Root336D2]KRB98228.1 two-component system response regulator [Duganella sp. Root198D2]